MTPEQPRHGVRRVFRLPLRGAGRAHADADAELDSFLEARVEHLVARGMSASDARAEALRRLGGTSVEEVRARLHHSAELREERMRTSERLETLRHDVRFALRRMRGEPAFVAFATLIVALGVAATTAVFSVMSPFVLRPLPFRDAERLAWVAGANGNDGGLSSQTSRAFNLRDWRAQAKSFEALTGFFAFFEYGSDNLVGSGPPERLVGVGVAQDFLDVLGVRPLLGRNFVAEESVWNGRPAVILTYGLWQRRFGGDPAIVGRAISLDNVPTTVVGVLPRSFDFASTFAPASRVDFLSAFPIAAETDSWGNTLSIVGRLKPGVTVRAAQAELDVINARLKAADQSRWGLTAKVSGLQEHIAGGFRSALYLLAAGAGLVLLVACANLSNLLLARAQWRQREMAVRSALGAGRRRLLAQLLVESVTLALGGGALGVLLAVAITRWVAGTSALRIPLLGSVAVDARAAAFTVVVTLLTGIVVGLAPALDVSRGGEAVTLREASRGSSDGRRRGRLRETLVVAEVAVACLLLVGGGLLLRSFVRVLHVDLGFDPDGAVAWQLNPGRKFANDSARVVFFDDVAARVAAVPGVRAVGLTDTPPLGRNRTWTVRVEGVAYDKDLPLAFPRLVDSRYLPAMRVPLVAGRQFTPDDGAGSPHVIILNRSAADALFPGHDAVGRNVLLGQRDPWRVVGVVGDVRHQSLESGAGSEMYIPYAQIPNFSALVMVVRSPLPVASLAGGVRAALRAAEPGMPTDDFQPLGDVVDRAVSPRRFVLLVLGAFAGTALLLAALGLYAVLSYTVSQRARELGIRIALGETPASVQRRVVTRTLLLAGGGVAIGSAAALAAARLIGSLLYGVGAADVPTFVATAALLLATAALAGYLPARRASSADPVDALRG
jgi:predicted permease